jgi:leucyl/phenylalanyl-tRNA---protein transferase
MSSSRVVWLSPTDPPEAFPDIGSALCEPDGLLAAGGDLSNARLLHAYRSGIFPWFDEGQPILWWSPNPRCVLRPREFQTSSRMRRTIRSSSAEITINRSFSDVIRSCSGPRRSEQGTWITADMIEAYKTLHEDGWAHSIEVREDDTLVGGLYGLAIGQMFFGESMFSLSPNASKLAMLALTEILDNNAFEMIDCQVISQHLLTLGAVAIPRQEFASHLQSSCPALTRFADWPASPLYVSDLRPK